MNSNKVKVGPERAPHRSLLKAVGYSDEQIKKPLIGIVNSFNEIVPGHAELTQIARAVKDGVLAAGGTPMEFNVIGVCDGIAMGHNGMRYSLASREVIADSIECMVMAHSFDALVFIPNCDKIVPGMLMAASRLNLPAIFVSGGPMLSLEDDKGCSIDLNSVFEAVGAFKAGKMDEEELAAIENSACPTCGSCSGMFTANSLNCLSEALGIALAGNGSVPAVYAERKRLAKAAGAQIMQLLEKDIRALDIITAESLQNALVVDMALGCSTNSVLHLAALAHEADLEFDLRKLNEISERTPNLCRLAPAGTDHMQDLNRAGGVHAVMSELAKANLLNTEVITATGKTLGENLENWCYEQYKNVSLFGFKTSTFEKDNVVVRSEGDTKGTKGDYIFKVYNDSNHSILLTSAMVEMKSEALESENKKKNADHYKKLHEDRVKKNLEYAILVSELEYNVESDAPIFVVDQYEKMYVVRPQFFVTLLGIIESIGLKYADIITEKETERIEFKESLEILEAFEAFKEEILNNSIRHIGTQMENIRKRTETIISSADAIKESTRIVLDTHLNTIKSKIESFSIRKVLNHIDKVN